eukprot:TRINITY_DN2915_c0_g1_i2.p2 TRINITY_DN2915_c0_g1~~TRINITY_DN2915_c0_g1_i2.p2  ORF type:complete len:183 (+),score=22.07 TRINITY_DN2915_c0_g1_i2:105-653(+)
MSLSIRLFKQRQRFAAAHFTIYPNGEAERLHGHNYTAEVVLHAKQQNLEDGLLVPFHVVKDSINKICDEWNERVLMPAKSRFLTIEESGTQYEIHLQTPTVTKRYSIPKEDVVLLDCDNISSENMAVVTLGAFLDRLPQSVRNVTDKVTVTISEGPGSEASIEVEVPRSKSNGGDVAAPGRE